MAEAATKKMAAGIAFFGQPKWRAICALMSTRPSHLERKFATL
jgi:hypothetical protein